MVLEKIKLGPLSCIRTQHSLGCVRISQVVNTIVGLNMVP
jgi:hypothetical protein